MLRPLLLLYLSATAAASACTCMATYSTCNAVRISSLVFAGTVEAIEPRFLSRWNLLSRTPEIARLEADSSPDSLAKLKAAYLDMIPDLPESARRAVQSAGTRNEAQMAVFHALDRNIQVRFKVRTVFHAGKDDDDDEQPDEKMKTVTITTDSGDCGYEFIPGETYLVYASNDEQTGTLVTGKCSRTRRLTDAGEDLSYLYFLKNAGEESIRLEGYVTTDRREMYPDRSHYTGKIGAPLAAAVIEVKSDTAGAARFAETDAGGRFLLDGLTAGDYTVRAYEPGFPITVHLTAGPAKVHAEKGQCPAAVLLSPKREVAP